MGDTLEWFPGAVGGTYEAQRAEAEAQCRLIRDLFVNPFRPPHALDPAWLRWHDGVVVALAQDIDDGRAFDRMPILTDALQDAGCEDADLLDHCRGPGPHARGCWVIDLILGAVGGGRH
jgi:hypothetical protein